VGQEPRRDAQAQLLLLALISLAFAPVLG